MGHTRSCLDYNARVSKVFIACDTIWGWKYARLVALTFEDRLWLCSKRKCGFKGILHAMFAKHFKKFGRARIRIYYGIGIWNLDTKSIWGEIFAILH